MSRLVNLYFSSKISSHYYFCHRIYINFKTCKTNVCDDYGYIFRQYNEFLITQIIWQKTYINYITFTCLFVWGALLGAYRNHGHGACKIAAESELAELEYQLTQGMYCF